jgi:hypothetical protein
LIISQNDLTPLALTSTLESQDSPKPQNNFHFLFCDLSIDTITLKDHSYIFMYSCEDLMQHDKSRKHNQLDEMLHHNYELF